MKQKNKKLQDKKRNKSSKKQSPEKLQTISQNNYLEIFNHFLDDHQKFDKLIIDLQKYYQQDIENETESIRISFLILIFKICGLDEYIERINPDEIMDSIQKIFQSIYKQPNKFETSKNIYLIDKKNKEYKMFRNNFSKFWEILFSERIDFLSESNILDQLNQYGSAFCNSKIRIIRIIMIEFFGLVLEKAVSYYKKLQQINKNSKQAKLKKFIIKIFKSILKQRLKDIDLAIRQKLISIIINLYMEIPDQILTIQQLNSTFTPLIMNLQNQQVALKSLQKLYLKDFGAQKVLIQYGNLIIQKLYQIIIKQKKSSLLAIQLVNILKLYDNGIRIPDKYVLQIYDRISSNVSKQMLSQLASLFYKIQFTEYGQKNQKSQLQKLDQKQIISAIILKLQNIANKNKIQIIFTSLINFHKILFKCQQLFVLLMQETLFKQSEPIKMTKNQIKYLLIFIFAYIKYIISYQQDKNEKTQQYRSKAINIYNRCVFIYCKQIFYNKIPDNLEIAFEYLKLYNFVETPVSVNFQSYLDIIIQRLLIFFQKFQDPHIIKEIVSLMRKLYTKNINIMVQQIRIQDIERLDYNTIIRYSAVISHFKIDKLLSNSILKSLINNFQRINNNNKLEYEILNILYHSHLWKFKELFQSKSESVYKSYIQYREQLMKFLVQNFSKKVLTEQTKSILFNLICEILSVIMNNKLNDIQIIFYEPEKQLMLQIFCYLRNNLNEFKSDKPNQSLLNQFSKLDLNLQADQKQQILLNNIFKVFSNSYRFCIHPNSIQFLLDLLSKQQINYKLKQSIYDWVKLQVIKQNQNKFVFWKIFRQFILKQKSQSKLQFVIKNTIQLYFQKKNNKQQYKTLQNKLILFIAQTIQYALLQKQYTLFYVLEQIVKKTFRRYQKIILSKLYAHFNSKYLKLSQDQKKQKMLKSFRRTLQKYSTVAQASKSAMKSASKKKMIQQQEQKQQEQQQQQQQQRKEQEEQSDESDLDIQPKRVTRSMKKQKYNRQKNKK